MPKLSCLVLQILVAMKKIKVQTFHRKMKKNKKINNSKRCTSRKKYAVIRYPNVSPPRGMPKDNNTRDNTMFALWWCVCVLSGNSFFSLSCSFGFSLNLVFVFTFTSICISILAYFSLSLFLSIINIISVCLPGQ